ncbi:MAG: CoA transferase, partial [Chloroflexi bacterium]|nr:CoA transferase [Chloroflexota bacterium]
PFGQTGPYSMYKATDLVNMALGGFMYVSGDEDRSPVRLTFPISYSHAGAEAAAAMMLASYHRDATGEGQFIDVSIQQCVVWTLMNTTVTWDLLHVNVMRGAGVRANAATGVRTRSIWPCADGYVTFGITGGVARAGGMRYLTNQMAQDGMASEFLLGFDWLNFDARSMTQEQYDRLEGEIGPYLMVKTMNELYDYAVKGRILLAPITTPREIIESPQLAARNSFVEIEHPELGHTVTYPNAFVKMSAWAPRISRRAPLIGEHNQEILGGELGLTAEQLAILKQAGAI